ncbi:DUF2207 domain-containing protein [Spiractinospora alimapuensis]|uniref:DUF2207 domain-containing protein n=1 Tax=Spiractinospora alimapuensis TaxID=2820884 RepID=UPI001F23ECED|nr:DUF2207 domain-containing protein [Spiractinospora alimapuensis]QVQ52730.1 DUF2207 domain-containing protein [Spiractinospora alimapuensis]
MRRLLMALAGGFATALLLPTPALADAEGERAVTAFEVDVAVDEEGTVRVTERLTYAFGDDHASVLRSLPHHASIAGSAERDLGLANVQVTDAAGERSEIDTGPSETEIEIGEEGMAGTPTYEITYEYRSLLVATPNGDARLFLDVVGGGWAIPVRDVNTTVTLPHAPNATNCYAGERGVTTPCDRVSSDGGTVTATHDTIVPGDAMSVDLTFPAEDLELDEPPAVSSEHPESQTGGTAYADGQDRPWYRDSQTWFVVAVFVMVGLGLVRNRRRRGGSTGINRGSSHHGYHGGGFSGGGGGGFSGGGGGGAGGGGGGGGGR